MADGFKVEVHDDDLVIGALSAIGTGLSATNPGLGLLAAAGASAVRQYAPRRTGRLVASVQASAVNGRVLVRATVPYAGPINYGWAARNIEPAGFLQRADAVLQPLAVRLLEDGIDKTIHSEGLDK